MEGVGNLFLELIKIKFNSKPCMKSMKFLLSFDNVLSKYNILWKKVIEL